MMYLVAIAWLYVVVLMALAEGTATGGSWLGAAFTFLLYGAVPLGISLYLLAAGRRRASPRRARLSRAGPRRSRRQRPCAGDAVAPIGKEP
jgi:hypothetical protein